MTLPLGIPSPDISSFSIGPFTVHFYALCILVGIIAAGFLTNARLTRRGAEPGVVLDFILFTVPLGIIGARVFHVVTHPNDYFAPGINPWTALYIWEGGIAIFGALLGGAVGAWIACKVTGVRFWTFADALAPGLLLAQAFGRLGNWFNSELFGTPTTLPWGLEISSSNPAYPVGLPDGVLFHPTFLYEILWNLAGVAVILLAERAWRLQWGRAFAIYLIWYGAGRMVWESIRIDPSEVFLGVRVNVWAALLALVLGLVIFFWQKRRHPGLEPSAYQPGREWSPDGQASADVEYVDVSAPVGDTATADVSAPAVERASASDTVSSTR